MMSDSRIWCERKVIFALFLITLRYEVRSNVATWTAALVFCCTLGFFCVNNVFCHGSMSTFTRDELVNIRTRTPTNLFLDFNASPEVLMDILAKGALTFAHFSLLRRYRTGKRLCQRKHLRPLMGIILSNVRSLCNKLDKLQLRLGKNSDLSASSVMCFTETWHRRPTRRRRRAGSWTRYSAWSYPDALVIVLGYFNKGNLTYKLPN